MRLGSQSLICVPIIYEKKTFGILTVDNSKSSRPLRQSDMSLLMGVASQLAISIANAMAFEKLHSSEKKYRELVENANSIILRVDTEGRISYFNEFAQRFFGYNEKELIGKNAEHIILPASDPNQLSFRKLISSLRNDPNQHMVSENETKTKSREAAWIAWTYKPIFSAAETLVEILCIGNDITELKQAQQERERWSRLLNDAVDSIPNGFGVYDADRRLVLGNGAFASFYGQSIGDMIGQSATEILTPAAGLTRSFDGRPPKACRRSQLDRA